MQWLEYDIKFRGHQLGRRPAAQQEERPDCDDERYKDCDADQAISKASLVVIFHAASIPFLVTFETPDFSKCKKKLQGFWKRQQVPR